MPAARPDDIVRAGAEVRGTQSFVHVMASIFRRSDLVAAEIGWRIFACLPFYLPLAIAFGALGMDVHFRASQVAQYSSSPLILFDNLRRDAWVLGVTPKFTLTILAAVTFWAIISAAGRIFILRRLQPSLALQLPSVVTLTVLRVWAFALLIAAWIRGFVAIYEFFITVPASLGDYPSYVGGFAIFTILTLVLFMLWSVVSWIFPAATILAMSRRLSLLQSLRAAWASRALRSKLIEINLVMGIVKVALLVLALVFSACPLPFSNVETQTFLNWWWFGCFLFWVIASDYFHVVRIAATLALCRAYEAR